MVLVFTAFMFLMDVPELHRRLVNAFADDRYVPALRDFVSSHSLAMLGILLGGLSQAPPPGDPRCLGSAENDLLGRFQGR
jgi:hypothetical protein